MTTNAAQEAGTMLVLAGWLEEARSPCLDATPAQAQRWHCAHCEAGREDRRLCLVRQAREAWQAGQEKAKEAVA